MVLLAAVAFGLLAGFIRARRGGRRLTPPELSLTWLAVVAFIPQLLAFYLPATQELADDYLVAAGLVGSQIGLLVFAWFNRRQVGVWLLGLGLVLNLLVITLNGGLMPISPEMVEILHPNYKQFVSWEVGGRVGASKNIMLPPAETRLWFLSDRFLLPLPKRGVVYPVAFSLGDIFIAVGAFWLLWAMGGPRPQTSPSSEGSQLLKQS
jgi:hypothetical protein